MFDLQKLRNENRFAMTGNYHVYITIPFCKQRCPFCCFTSGFQRTELTNLSLIDSYIDALLKQIEATDFPITSLQTIVIGGGTPTLISGEQIKCIVDKVIDTANPILTDDFTISFETTPELASVNKLQDFFNAGARRVSIGVQSYLQSDLKLLGRKNTPAQALAAFNNAREAGFKSINIDILAAFPGSTFDNFKFSLTKALEQMPEFITVNMMAFAYSGADDYLHALATKGHITPTYEERVAMFSMAFEELERHGYEPIDFVVFGKKGLSFAYEVHGLGMADNVVGLGPWTLSALPEEVRISPPFIEGFISNPYIRPFTSPYKDNIYQIIHGQLICNAQVSDTALRPMIGCSLREAIATSERASTLVNELETRGLIVWGNDGFEIPYDHIPAGLIYLWDYQRRAKMAV